MSRPSIRPATPDDIPAITDIYNHAVEHTTASWDHAPVDLASRVAWFNEHSVAGHPILVAVQSGTVVGWAAYGRFRPKAGWDTTMEHTLYIAPEARGQGVGRLLLVAVVEQARANDVHVLLGAVSSDNEVSLALHRSLGFVETGRMPEVGRKFGRWLELVWMQRILTADPDPAPEQGSGFVPVG